MWGESGWFRRRKKSTPAESGTAVDPSGLIRQHCIFSGTVQHVGFRYEAMLLAEQLELTGWIRNNADGTVEGEIQGTADAVKRFVPCMKCIRRIRITNVKIQDVSVVPNEQEFRVSYADAW